MLTRMLQCCVLCRMQCGIERVGLKLGNSVEAMAEFKGQQGRNGVSRLHRVMRGTNNSGFNRMKEVQKTNFGLLFQCLCGSVWEGRERA